MSATATAKLSVEDKLKATWRRECRFKHLRGVSLLVIWGIVLVLLNLLIDWLFLIPGFGRVILLLLNLGTLGAVCYFHWYRKLRTFDPVRVALQVEKKHPEFKSLLISYIQLKDTDPEKDHASPELLRAMKRQTMVVTGPIDFRAILNLRELKRILMFSIGTLLLFGVLSIQWSEFFKVLAFRLFNPAYDAGYPTDTLIEKISGHLTVRQDDAVNIEIIGGGQLPREGKLYIKAEEGSWEKLLLPRTRSNAYSYKFPQVYKSFKYRVRLGDAISKTYKVKVVPPPRLLTTKLVLKHPKYTHLLDRETQDLNVDAPEGTEIEGRLEVSMPLRGAEIVPEEEAPLPLQVEDGGLVLKFKLVATQTLSFSFRWQEKEHGFTYLDPVRHMITVKPDAAPRVELLDPMWDGKATVEKNLAVLYRATDDYGVTGAAIVYALNDQPENRRSLPDPNAKLEKQKASWQIKDDIANLKPGDVVTLSVEVTDNRPEPNEPNVTRSKERRIEILTRDEYLRYILEQKSVLVEKIERLKKEEEKASKEVEKIKDKNKR